MPRPRKYPEADEGLRPDLPTSQEREEIKELRRENFELRRANEILKSASAYYERRKGERAARAIVDERLLSVIEHTHARNHYAYGYRRMWKAMLSKPSS